jgi:hypothetical protein
MTLASAWQSSSRAINTPRGRLATTGPRLLTFRWFVDFFGGIRISKYLTSCPLSFMNVNYITDIPIPLDIDGLWVLTGAGFSKGQGMRCGNVVIADRHPVVLQSLISLLGVGSGFKVVASCSNGTTCMEAIRGWSRTSPSSTFRCLV